MKFCEKKITKVMPGGVVGATFWKAHVDCYTLKCTKITLLQELVCFSVFTSPSFCMS